MKKQIPIIEKASAEAANASSPRMSPSLSDAGDYKREMKRVRQIINTSSPTLQPVGSSSPKSPGLSSPLIGDSVRMSALNLELATPKIGEDRRQQYIEFQKDKSKKQFEETIKTLKRPTIQLQPVAAEKKPSQESPRRQIASPPTPVAAQASQTLPSPSQQQSILSKLRSRSQHGNAPDLSDPTKSPNAIVEQASVTPPVGEVKQTVEKVAPATVVVEEKKPPVTPEPKSGSTPASPAASVVPGDKKTVSPASKLGLNPNAKEFKFNPNAKAFVPKSFAPQTQNVSSATPSTIPKSIPPVSNCASDSLVILISDNMNEVFRTALASQLKQEHKPSSTPCV